MVERHMASSDDVTAFAEAGWRPRQEQTITKTHWGWHKKRVLYTLGRNTNYSYYGSWSKIKKYLRYDPAVLSLDNYAKAMKSVCQNDRRIQIYCNHHSWDMNSAYVFISGLIIKFAVYVIIIQP